MDHTPMTLAELQRLFALPSPRATRAALRALGLRLRGRGVPQAALWQALGLAPGQTPEAAAALAAPLMKAAGVAALRGVDTETVHRWCREGSDRLPPPLRLGGPRRTRWIRAEVLAREGLAPDPGIARAAPRPAFGALVPVPGPVSGPVPGPVPAARAEGGPSC